MGPGPTPPARRPALTEGPAMSPWVPVLLLGLEAHLAASSIAPLRTEG